MESLNAKTVGLNLFAGGSLGLLIGILAGMAESPVIGALLGTLATAGAAFLTLHKDGDSSANLVRIGGFALLCIVGALSGVYVRANDLLGLTPARYIRQMEDAGLSPADAIALYKMSLSKVSSGVGSLLGDSAKTPTPADGGFFAGSTTDQAAMTDMIHKNPGWKAIVTNVGKAYPKWSETVDALDKSTLTDDNKRAILFALVQAP